jgi:hypothetical protein
VFARTVASFAIEVIGWTGTSLVLGAFLLLQTRKLGHASWAYLWMNFFGGLFIGLNSYFNGALPSVALNFAWVVIAAYGMVRSVSERRTRQSAPSESHS